LDGTIYMETLAELLDRNDYRVIVQTTDGGCLTTFPNRVELPTPHFYRLYQEFRTGGVLVCRHDEAGSEVDLPVTTPCPPYAQRVYTMYHILSYCMSIGYAGGAIKFMVGDKEVEEDEFYDANCSPHMLLTDIGKESQLRMLIAMSFQQGFTPEIVEMAKQDGMLGGYLAIRSLFIPEGHTEP